MRPVRSPVAARVPPALGRSGRREVSISRLAAPVSRTRRRDRASVGLTSRAYGGDGNLERERERAPRRNPGRAPPADFAPPTRGTIASSGRGRPRSPLRATTAGVRKTRRLRDPVGSRRTMKKNSARAANGASRATARERTSVTTIGPHPSPAARTTSGAGPETGVQRTRVESRGVASRGHGSGDEGHPRGVREHVRRHRAGARGSFPQVRAHGIPTHARVPALGLPLLRGVPEGHLGLCPRRRVVVARHAPSRRVRRRAGSAGATGSEGRARVGRRVRVARE